MVDCNPTGRGSGFCHGVVHGEPVELGNSQKYCGLLVVALGQLAPGTLDDTDPGYIQLNSWWEECISLELVLPVAAGIAALQIVVAVDQGR